jgi:hypothetical protein
VPCHHPLRVIIWVAGVGDDHGLAFGRDALSGFPADGAGTAGDNAVHHPARLARQIRQFEDQRRASSCSSAAAGKRVAELFLAIQAARICWPAGSRISVSRTLANGPGRRCSRLRTSRPLIPYSASPERLRGAAVLLPHRPPPHVPGHLLGQLHDVEQVHRDLRMLQHPAHYRGIDRAHVDGHQLDGIPSGRRRPGWLRFLGGHHHFRYGGLISRSMASIVEL